MTHRDGTDACTRCKTRIPMPENGTELGHISRLLAAVSVLETPLLRQIKKFGYTTTAVIRVAFTASQPPGH